ncbi:uncharacterized protein J4E78_009503 [Alternaria triticimaculans]|uniref:uncharacterized protein n=1 Tax=Alternaria triticimaculans TaxID=297637 RepID=UPI0020C4A2B7|nr:uncharacterized protein J4E78_009503 [Alternaria triticimaculans]KAI4644684.1 hypothetical protein J4E78_009503 [Alternaria triticimaculans]
MDYQAMLQEARQMKRKIPGDRKNKNALLAAFLPAQGLGTASSDSEERLLINTSFLPRAYPPSVVPLKNLQPIAIKDLRLERHHRDRYIVLRSITSPKRMAAIEVLAEDEHGDDIPLRLYQQDDEATRPATDIIDKHSVVLIKEPFFKFTAAGDYSLRVDHLSDVVFVSDNDAIVPDLFQRPRHAEVKTAETLKLEGNALIDGKKYWQAIHRYSAALLQSPTPDEIKVIKLNRSLAYLSTKQYEAALWDTGYPSFGEEGSEMAMLLASQALYHLRHYDECCDLLKELCKLSPTDQDAADALARAQRRCDECNSGRFDFKHLRSEATEFRPPHLDHGSYIAPVEDRPVQGKGRGLFTTRPLKVGDLVLCEKAFSHAHLDDGQRGNASITRLVNVESGLDATGVRADLIRLIAQKLFKNPSLAPDFTTLYHGNYQAVATQRVDDQPVVDTFLIERIEAFNNFSCPLTSLNIYKDRIAGITTPKEDLHNCGVWIKASYINHSCLGNVCRTFIGDMMIIRATKDLDVGTELTFPYVYPTGKYDMKMDDELKTWGFTCNCPLCKDIKATKASNLTKRQNLLNQVVKLCKSPAAGIQFTNKIERLAEALNETYTRPAEEVPRLLLWSPYLLLTRIYMKRSIYGKALETMGKFLQALGFTFTGLDRKSSPLMITGWGHVEDRLVDVFLHARSAFEQLGLSEKSQQADKYARVVYRVVVGEDTSFDETHPRSP